MQQELNRQPGLRIIRNICEIHIQGETALCGTPLPASYVKQRTRPDVGFAHFGSYHFRLFNFTVVGLQPHRWLLYLETFRRGFESAV